MHAVTSCLGRWVYGLNTPDSTIHWKPWGRHGAGKARGCHSHFSGILGPAAIDVQEDHATNSCTNSWAQGRHIAGNSTTLDPGMDWPYPMTGVPLGMGKEAREMCQAINLVSLS
jgi:hypothetical protein